MSPANNFFSGSGTGKAPAEKSNFVQTCNRLSLFLKEKGNLRDLSFGINAKSDATEASPATVDLLSNLNNPGEKASEAENIIPQYVILDSSSELEDSLIKASSVKTAQMTIFYGGEILVLDDVPADRARDLMLIAQKSPRDGKNENRVELMASNSKHEADGKGSDLPIARRASLHKFLAKRKDRATVRAPYEQVHNYSPGGGGPGGASSSGNQHSFDLNN